MNNSEENKDLFEPEDKIEENEDQMFNAPEGFEPEDDEQEDDTSNDEGSKTSDVKSEFAIQAESESNPEVKAKLLQLDATSRMMAEQMRMFNENMSKMNAFMQKAEEQGLVDGKKFDTTKPRPLTRSSLIAYIKWLKRNKPAVFMKKRAELESKLAKLK